MPDFSHRYDDHRLTYAEPDDPWWRKSLIWLVEYSTGRARIQRLYREIKDESGEKLWYKLLSQLQVTLDFERERLQAVPAGGPLIVIANHPFGVADGLALSYLTSLVRPNFVVMVNQALCRNRQLAPYLLPIDFRETKAALQTNLQSREQAIAKLKQGAALAIFPSGGVATSKTWCGPAEELEWKRFTARLIQQTQATVLPLYFHGQNSRLFQIASQFSVALRLGLFLFEARRRMGKTVRIEIGRPIPYSDMAQFRDRQALLDFLQTAVMTLGGNKRSHDNNKRH